MAPDSPAQPNRTASALASGSIVLLVVFVLIIAVEHVIQPRLTPAHYTVSEYARAGGLAGSAAVAAFVCWSVALLLAAAALLASETRRQAAMRATAPLLVVAALGIATAATFRTQAVRGSVPRYVTRTTAGELHDLGTGLAEVALFAGALAAALLAGPRRLLRAISVAAVLLAIALGPTLSLAGVGAKGLRQRLLITVACVWQLTVLDMARRANSPS